MFRAIFLTAGVLATVALAAVGAATVGIVGAVAAGIWPMEEASGLLAQAVEHVEAAGCWFGGAAALAMARAARPYLTAAMRDWFSEMVRAQVEKHLITEE